MITQNSKRKYFYSYVNGAKNCTLQFLNKIHSTLNLKSRSTKVLDAILCSNLLEFLNIGRATFVTCHIFPNLPVYPCYNVQA